MAPFTFLSYPEIAWICEFFLTSLFLWLRHRRSCFCAIWGRSDFDFYVTISRFFEGELSLFLSQPQVKIALFLVLWMLKCAVPLTGERVFDYLFMDWSVRKGKNKLEISFYSVIWSFYCQLNMKIVGRFLKWRTCFSTLHWGFNRP